MIARRWTRARAGGDDFGLFFAGEFVRRFGGEEAGVEAAAPARRARRGIHRQGEKGAAEDAGEADFVGSAGDGAEQIEDVEDFLLGVEGVAADEVVVETLFAERFFVEADVAEGAEEDGDVAGFEAACLLSFRFDDGSFGESSSSN